MSCALGWSDTRKPYFTVIEFAKCADGVVVPLRVPGATQYPVRLGVSAGEEAVFQAVRLQFRSVRHPVDAVDCRVVAVHPAHVGDVGRVHVSWRCFGSEPGVPALVQIVGGVEDVLVQDMRQSAGQTRWRHPSAVVEGFVPVHEGGIVSVGHEAGIRTGLVNRPTNLRAKSFDIG